MLGALGRIRIVNQICSPLRIHLSLISQPNSKCYSLCSCVVNRRRELFVKNHGNHHDKHLSTSSSVLLALKQPLSPPAPSISKKKKKEIKITSQSQNQPHQDPPLSSASSSSPSITDVFSSPQTSTAGSSYASSLYDSQEWVEIYRFPYISAVHVLQRMKIYQTVFTAGVLFPVSCVCYALEVFSPELFGFVVGGASLACSVLYVSGLLVTDLVGIIYVTSKDPEIVRVAHMTFWGKRVDDIFLKKDFVPLMDLNDHTLSDAYANLQLYSDPERKLKLSFKYGRVHDSEKFLEIFGTSPELIIKKKDGSSS